MKESPIDYAQPESGQKCSPTAAHVDECDFAAALAEYQHGNARQPLFFQGDSLRILRALPANSFDCCMTSPPYWSQRQYAATGIGLESDSSLLALKTEWHSIRFVARARQI